VESRPVLNGATNALNSALKLISQYVIQNGGQFLKEKLPEELEYLKGFIGQAYKFTGQLSPLESTRLTQEEEKLFLESESALQRQKECLERLVDQNTTQKAVGDDDDEIFEENSDVDKNDSPFQTPKSSNSSRNQLKSTGNKGKLSSTPQTEETQKNKKRRKIDLSVNGEDESEQIGPSFEIQYVLFVSKKLGILVCWKGYDEEFDSVQQIQLCNCHQLVFDYIICSYGLRNVKDLKNNLNLWK
jgi:hypothetical protein